jgi:hypothetical protein
MNMTRYQNQGLPELSNAFDRLVVLRDEMDRLFEGAFGPALFR